MRLHVSNQTQSIQNVLSKFTQRFQSSDQREYDIVNNGSLWESSIPEENSGTCLTYNPKMESDAGYWYSMMIEPNIEAAEGSSFDQKKRNVLNNMNMFLHEPNKFFYFSQEEAPNNIGIDLKWMQLHNRTRLVGN